MEKFQGALIREQGVEFAIVIVKMHVLNSSSRAQDAILAFQRFFPGKPVILMAQDSRGIPKYYGRNDIVNFMANVPIEAVQWQEFTVH
ncbi:hypothetical protein [Methanobacterium congolense]|uniref:Uncharacterized protein n=1 Tax=Methanobacterium congolense TaxID=118062 RepID=A0A1D3L1C6_9EURY|nr:hypothetical protein [Methanobacterium congolense]SCG85240.1 putative protein [Methanobacterium congolense]